MNITYDKHKLAKPKRYNKQNLVQCKCGKHWFPSKKMFIEFLKQFDDVDADAEIWTEEDWNTGKVTIHVELSYMTPDYKPTPVIVTSEEVT